MHIEVEEKETKLARSVAVQLMVGCRTQYEKSKLIL